MSLSPVLDTSPPTHQARAAWPWARPDDGGAALFISKPAEPIATALGVIALVVAAVLFARSAGLIAALWGAGGLAVGIWLRENRGRTWDLCFGGLLTMSIVTAEVLIGNSIQVTALLTVANMLEIILAVALARRFGGGLNLTTINGVIRFLVTAVVLAPFPAAVMAAIGLGVLRGDSPEVAFLTWWFGHALSIAGVGGVILGLGKPVTLRAVRPRRVAEAAALLLIMAGITYAVFSPLRFPVGILAIPLSLIIAVRLRFVGMSMAIILITTFAVGGSMQGYGLFADDFTPEMRAVMAQVVALVGFVPMLVVVGVLEERDGLTDRARLAQIQAERASDGKSRLLANVSHEIKSPIAGVIGIGELWRDGKLGPATESQVEMADMLVKTARQIEGLAYDLLDVAQAEAGAVSVDFKPVDVSSLLEDIRRSARLRPESEGIKFEFVPFPNKLIVNGDSVRLSQVLANFASNALKYGRNGGVVRLAAELRPDGWVRMSVSDHGPGLSAAKQAELFEPFNRLGMERSSVEGHGIGLALAKRLVELMGGRIGVTSQEGRGATFWIELPSV